MDIKIGIYKITSPTGKIYVGRSINILKRWVGYKTKTTNKQTKLYYSFKKHGVLAHTFEILEECEKCNLNERETHYISLFKSYNTEHGLNLTGGGEGALYLTLDARKKIGEFHKGNKYNLGRVTSEKTKEKLREVGKVRVFTELHRQRISQSNKGRLISEITKEKIRLARSKQIMKSRIISQKQKDILRNLFTGKKHSDQAKQKVSESLREQWSNGTRKRAENRVKTGHIKMNCFQFSTNGVFIKMFTSMTLAAKETSISVGNISKCMNNKAKTAGGFIWRKSLPEQCEQILNQYNG